MDIIYRTKEFVETMCNLAFRCEAFIFANGGEIVFTAENNNIVALSYAIGRKGKYKRVLREVNGQLMQITDRREQYYAKLQSHDDSANLQAERKFRFPKRPKPFISEHERMMQD